MSDNLRALVQAFEEAWDEVVTGVPVSVDLYRFRGFSAAEWGDLEPYFEDAICFVEWPEAAAGSLPPVRVEVRLSHVDPTHRLLTLDSTEESLLTGLFGGADSRV